MFKKKFDSDHFLKIDTDQSYSSVKYVLYLGKVDQGDNI